MITCFFKIDWFSSDGVIEVSEKGPMVEPLIAAFIQHLNHTARKRVLSSTSFLLCLDVHASRMGNRWFENYVDRKIEVVVNAVNTVYFLQPYDKNIKKCHELIAELRDEFLYTMERWQNESKLQRCLQCIRMGESENF